MFNGQLAGVADGEILVEVFLGLQPGAPGRYAASAVVERAQNTGSCWVTWGAHAGMARRRTGNGDRGGAGNATVVGESLTTCQLPEPWRITLDLDHAHSVRREVNGDVLVAVGTTHQIGVHHGGVGIFKTDAQQTVVTVAAARGEGAVANKIVVEAKLTRLVGGGLLIKIKCWCAWG